jgi:hypothetical protein
VAHLTPGEMVLPRSLQTPELMKHIASLAARQGLDPARLAVGHRANSINPRTGTREFNFLCGGNIGECFDPTGNFNPRSHFDPDEIVVTGFRDRPGISVDSFKGGGDRGPTSTEQGDVGGGGGAPPTPSQVEEALKEFSENAKPYDAEQMHAELVRLRKENLEKLKYELNNASANTGYVAIAAGGLTLIMVGAVPAFLVGAGFGIMAISFSQMANAIDRALYESNDP